MKIITFSPLFQKQIEKIKKKDCKLFIKFQKQLGMFQSDPNHASLRLHKLKGELQNVWSLSIDLNVRVLFISDDKYYFFNIGSHEQVYKK